MIILRFISFSLILASILLVGCNKKEPGLYVNESQKAFDTLTDKDVLLSINGEKFLKRDLLNLVETKLTLIQKKRKISNKRIETLRKKLIQAGIDEYFRSSLLCRYAAENGVIPTPEERNAFIGKFLHSISPKDKNIDHLYNSFKDKGEILKKMLERDLTVSVLQKRFLADELKVSDQEIDAFIERINKVNAVAAASNTLIYAHATNIWTRLKGGENFSKLADRYSETDYKDPGGSWGTFSQEELSEDPSLLEILDQMHEGEITPPVEADGGLVIAKIDKLSVEELNSKVQILKQQKVYDLSYIYFRLPQFYDVPTREEAERLQRPRKRQMIYNKLLPKILKTNRVEYPNGNNFFPKK